jgi:lipopolysaccharide/colanic/teichoic acid biosynthesis glycosyltransferase
MSVRPDSKLRRLVDVVVSAVLLLVLTPLFVAVAIAVRLESAGPVFYRAARVGRNDEPFAMLKFRSMQADADRNGAGVSAADDARVTRVGLVLRATKLDELPQLLNVLQGTMTLVGPRAESPQFVAHYLPQERLLLAVRPGVTGPGQIDFTRHQAAELNGVADPDRYYVEHQMHGKLALDLEYLRDRTLRNDVGILGSTLALVLAAAWRSPAPG